MFTKRMDIDKSFSCIFLLLLHSSLDAMKQPSTSSTKQRGKKVHLSKWHERALTKNLRWIFILVLQIKTLSIECIIRQVQTQTSGQFHLILWKNLLKENQLSSAIWYISYLKTRIQRILQLKKITSHLQASKAESARIASMLKVFVAMAKVVVVYSSIRSETDTLRVIANIIKQIFSNHLFTKNQKASEKRKKKRQG